MDLPDPFRLDGHHIGIELPGARALFTTRRGGVSRGAYTSLNLGLWTEDAAAHVGANRERVAEQVGIERGHFAQGRQVHEADVRRVTEMPRPGYEPEPADGQATNLQGVAPVVLTADCLPVAIAGGGAVAMVHAGWRGLAAGVLEEGVRAVRELGADGELHAAIGPGVGVCCYEAGREVHDAFAAHADVASRGTHVDLKAVARVRLGQAGVPVVDDTGLCTMCSHPSLFFSHRRDAGVTGRQGGVAWRV